MVQLPPFIMTSEQGSFARNTIENRKPMIIDQILAHYDYTPSIRRALMNFKEEMAHEIIQPLQENTSDRVIWDRDVSPWLGKNWLEIPWYLAEAFFYRRVLEITHYFQPGPWQRMDPYERLKAQEITEALPVFSKEYSAVPERANLENFQMMCYRALWGNRGDLSNLNTFETDMSAQSERIILNQSESAYKFLRQNPARIAYFFDNVGKELLFDLAFIDFLLRTGLAESVTGYMKNQPFFVSDAESKDLLKSVEYLSVEQCNEVKDLATRINQALKSDKLRLSAPPFLTTSRMYREMPSVFRNQLGEHELAILKGDVNYRRLFGDRHWDPTTKIRDAGGYFPTSFLSLRTLKAELILGLSKETFEDLSQTAESDWLINGKRGMITFLEN